MHLPNLHIALKALIIHAKKHVKALIIHAKG